MIDRQVPQLILIFFVDTVVVVGRSLIWEETGMPGENPCDHHTISHIKIVELESQRWKASGLSTALLGHLYYIKYYVLCLLDTTNISILYLHSYINQKNIHHIEIHIRSAGLELETFRIPISKECAENSLIPLSLRQAMHLLLMTNGTKRWCRKPFD